MLGVATRDKSSNLKIMRTFPRRSVWLMTGTVIYGFTKGACVFGCIGRESVVSLRFIRRAYYDNIFVSIFDTTNLFRPTRVTHKIVSLSFVKNEIIRLHEFIIYVNYVV